MDVLNKWTHVLNTTINFNALKVNKKQQTAFGILKKTNVLKKCVKI